jgi:hypothetical protein
MEDIMLPPASRDYITKAYTVVKVNSKNKEQKRYCFSFVCLFYVAHVLTLS